MKRSRKMFKFTNKQPVLLPASRKKSPKEHKPIPLKPILIRASIFAGICIGFFTLLFASHLLLARTTTLVNPLISGNMSFSSALAGELTHDSISFISIVQNTDNSYTVSLPNQILVTFSAQKDIQEQVSSLQTILNNSTIDTKHAYQIDFRYDTPVIRSTAL